MCFIEFSRDGKSEHLFPTVFKLEGNVMVVFATVRPLEFIH